MRYQWQYLQRSKAIFGLEEGAGQPAFAAALEGTLVEPRDILSAEAYVQHAFIQRRGTENALFEPEDLPDGVIFTSTGENPPFLDAL